MARRAAQQPNPSFFFMLLFRALLQQTHQTIKQTRRTSKNPLFPVFFCILEERSGKRKAPPTKNILESFLAFLSCFLSFSFSFFLLLLFSSFSFFYFSPFLLSFLEMFKRLFEQQRFPNNPSLLSLFFDSFENPSLLFRFLLDQFKQSLLLVFPSPL